MHSLPRERESALKQNTGKQEGTALFEIQQVNSLEQTISVVLTCPSLKEVRILNVSNNETKFDTCMSHPFE